MDGRAVKEMVWALLNYKETSERSHKRWQNIVRVNLKKKRDHKLEAKGKEIWGNDKFLG